MPEERTTIRRLAEASGVSVGTVSRALNGYADVNPETRERIMRLARELDYTPAAAARSLVTQRSHVIGVFLDTGEGHPDLQHPFFHEVLVGLKNDDRFERLRPAAVRVRAPRQRLRQALLPQALPASQRGRRRAHGHRPGGRRGAPAGALRAGHRRRRRRAGRSRHDLRDLGQRGRRSTRCRSTFMRSATAASPRSRGCSRPARAPSACAATGARCRPPVSPIATSTSPTGTSTRRAAAARWPSCSRSTSRRRRCSRRRT